MFDNDVLLSLPNNVWLLQLVGMQDHDTIMQYVKTHALKDQTRLYQTQKFGGNWYALLLNIDFATRQEALSIVNSLPPEIIAAGPFAKSSLAVQREILVTDENNETPRMFKMGRWQKKVSSRDPTLSSKTRH